MIFEFKTDPLRVQSLLRNEKQLQGGLIQLSRKTFGHKFPIPGLCFQETHMSRNAPELWIVVHIEGSYETQSRLLGFEDNILEVFKTITWDDHDKVNLERFFSEGKIKVELVLTGIQFGE